MLLILVVDDESMIGGLIQQAAQQNGWRTNVASSGEDALAYLDCVRPDLVISDHDMPGISGLELRRRMLMNPACNGIRFILMTGGVITERQAKEAGCDGFLPKPFTLAAFREMISRVCPEKN